MQDRQPVDSTQPPRETQQRTAGTRVEGIRAPGANIPGYLLPASVAVTLLCCPPTGIAALVYSVQARSKAQAGDTAGATQAAGNARIWLVVSVVAGVILLFLYLLLGLGSSGGSLDQYS